MAAALERTLPADHCWGLHAGGEAAETGRARGPLITCGSRGIPQVLDPSSTAACRLSLVLSCSQAVEHTDGAIFTIHKTALHCV